MAWISLPAVQATDWSAVTFLEQFWKAMRERQQALGQTPLIIVPEVGCDCQYMGELGMAVWPTGPTDKFSVQCVQAWIEQNCHNFVATIDSGGSPVGNYHGQATIEMWSWTKIKDRILDHGGGNKGWTHKDKFEGVPYTSYDKAYTGGYFGPWLWNELRTVFDELIWLKTTPSTAWTSNGETTQKYGDDFNNPNWDGAGGCKDLTEQDYDADPGSDGGTDEPYCWTEASGGPNYQAAMVRGYAYGYAGAPDGIAFTKDTDWYLKGELPPPGGDFDDNGQTITNDGNWARWTSENGQAGAAVQTSAAFGSLAYPVWCDQPGGAKAKGYGVGAVAVIWKYDVVGGFEYYT